jgi:hypothetical protein
MFFSFNNGKRRRGEREQERKETWIFWHPRKLGCPITTVAGVGVVA